jgi:hypothetical protein
MSSTHTDVKAVDCNPHSSEVEQALALTQMKLKRRKKTV